VEEREGEAASASETRRRRGSAGTHLLLGAERLLADDGLHRCCVLADGVLRECIEHVSWAQGDRVRKTGRDAPSSTCGASGNEVSCRSSTRGESRSGRRTSGSTRRRGPSSSASRRWPTSSTERARGGRCERVGPPGSARRLCRWRRSGRRRRRGTHLMGG